MYPKTTPRGIEWETDLRKIGAPVASGETGELGVNEEWRRASTVPFSQNIMEQSWMLKSAFGGILVYQYPAPKQSLHNG